MAQVYQHSQLSEWTIAIRAPVHGEVLITRPGVKYHTLGPQDRITAQRIERLQRKEEITEEETINSFNNIRILGKGPY